MRRAPMPKGLGADSRHANGLAPRSRRGATWAVAVMLQRSRVLGYGCPGNAIGLAREAKK